MTFNYAQFKQAFREAAYLRGEDPVTREKISQYVGVHLAAEIRRDLHHSRERELVRRAAARQSEQARRGVRWSEGSGLLHPNGAINETLVAKAESTNWWDAMSPDDWKPGAGSSYVERQSMTPIRRNVRARRFQEAGDLVRELLEENPTQAAMRANLSQKEVV